MTMLRAAAARARKTGITNVRFHRMDAERLDLADIYKKLTPWQKTQVARHPQRPHFSDYVKTLVTEWTPLAGDRKFAEDAALQAGFGRFGQRSHVFLIADEAVRVPQAVADRNLARRLVSVGRWSWLGRAGYISRPSCRFAW